MATPLNTHLNILVVEDNNDLREATVDALITVGHHARGVDCAEAIPELAGLPSIDLMVIDLNLPGEDGISLAHRLRQTQPEIGIVMLTARNRPEDKSAGYVNGADIYLTKPASLEELDAAIQALARRLRRMDSKALRLDIRRMALLAEEGQITPLTSQEASLLAAFVRAPQQRLENWQIVEILGKDDAAFSKAALELHIVRLRKKLQQAGGPSHSIKAIRGWGYQFCLTMPIV